MTLGGAELGATELVLGCGLLLVGGLVGLLVGRRVGGGASRARTLERDLREERERATAYREEVAKHFGGTSDLFGDLTRQYATLYAHLAEGARDLCADRLPEIGRGFEHAGPLLPPSAQAPSAEPSDETPSSEEAPEEPRSETPPPA